MNGLQAYIDLLEKSDLVTGITTETHVKNKDFLNATLSEERRRNTKNIIKDLKKIQI